MKIRDHRDLRVYQLAFECAMEIFHLTSHFPKEEKYSLTDQIRRTSRSVCANMSEAFRKRRYPKSFIAKLVDSEGEAGETQTWLQFSVESKYAEKEKADALSEKYNLIISQLITMENQPEKWSV
ncbi:MAG: four helix bundle protein [Ignavibacteria bacterium CG22_combo_CG10-13_8_21_14_all_37_15]|nr:four helix bundle protein [Ignavibacteria bacterium]OIO21495.1 MAG: four helix bundle protein [Ignavibacteria bacterium CG1_02_37_35]PIP77998.1 MAG: four helix bundle protein [Ignavibacteria bacterium CG22_combo_CG10-13_8_21_14_all_37_15]PIX94731.1 MAG: four helix bundle protein [Ignavibacteria bacterium CG_4_10_14_3_um_filter_37_18]PJC57900.1 MAG: four helix bundle protein [Ignavibacteria bacterium CG_4_9_14_0_2_um_filter_37_13]